MLYCKPLFVATEADMIKVMDRFGAMARIRLDLMVG